MLRIHACHADGDFLVLALSLLRLPASRRRRISAPVLVRTFPLEGVRGPADRTGIPGRIDHMAYDPATRRLFIACVANGSVEVIDLDAGKRIGTIGRLPGPQGVAVAGASSTSRPAATAG